MGNYIKLFNSVSAQTEFRNSENYIEPHVSCVEGGTNVKYNKRQEDFDIEIDCNGYGECSGQEILSMSSRVGPYELSEGGSGSTYIYSITNSNLTTSPLQTIKVKIVNGPNNSDGIYECTYYDNNPNHGGSYSISDDPYMAITVDASNNNEAGSLQAYLTEGC